MNRQTMLTFIVFTVVCLGASLFATQQLIARKRIEHENVVLQAQVEKQGKEQIENPHGSGHWIPDYNSVTCPGGSRCVAGECLR